jgi:hypothetical protein
MLSKIIRLLKDDLTTWLLPYLINSLLKKKSTHNGIIDICFCFVDHFEPGTGGVDPVTERNRIMKWVQDYPQLANKYFDADGIHPQHTFFVPPHYVKGNNMDPLIDLCKKGYGEIEFHYHHERIPPNPDNSELFRLKLTKYLKMYSQMGLFGSTKDNTKMYGFIHGKFSLDNALGEKYCGVNDELIILNETDCYGDFTFPSRGKAQPKKINSIYYAKDDPTKPKSYNDGIDVRVGGSKHGDLLIFQGPLGIVFNPGIDRKRIYIDIANIGPTDPPVKKRIDLWVRTGIRVIGKDNWIFIKIHTHGAQEDHYDALFGVYAQEMYKYLGKKYNDNNHYRLHYITAREFYNIVKAAEKGLQGNINDYREYILSKPKYNL